MVLGMITAKDIFDREPFTIVTPIRGLSSLEGITLGFRQEMLEVGPGKVDCGAGCGTDFIILTWGDRMAVVRGSELLKAWVATFSAEDAERIPTYEA